MAGKKVCYTIIMGVGFFIRHTSRSEVICTGFRRASWKPNIDSCGARAIVLVVDIEKNNCNNS